MSWASHRDDSFEYSQHMFYLRNNEDNLKFSITLPYLEAWYSKQSFSHLYHQWSDAGGVANSWATSCHVILKRQAYWTKILNFVENTEYIEPSHEKTDFGFSAMVRHKLVYKVFEDSWRLGK